MSRDQNGELTDNHEYFIPEIGSDDWGEPLNDNFRAMERSIPLVLPEDQITSKTAHDGAIAITSDSHKLFLGDGSDWNEVGSLSEGKERDDRGQPPGKQISKLKRQIRDLENRVEELES